MWYASDRIEDITIEYTQCEYLALSNSWTSIPDKYIDYNFRNNSKNVPDPQFSWRLTNDSTQRFEDERLVCEVQFQVPQTMKGPIYLYYRLHNFYANHRRFVKSFSEDQLNGKAASLDTIKNTVGQNCQPLSDVNGTRIYPCGLIANSLFNDTFTTAFLAVNGTSEDKTVPLTENGIAWSTDRNRFQKLHTTILRLFPT